MKGWIKYLNAVLANHCARYLVTDSCGTHILCYTLNGAISWISYCKYNAQIYDRYSCKIVIERKQFSPK